jgi:hypothetical protein
LKLYYSPRGACSSAVLEFRIDFGPGCRIYFGRDGDPSGPQCFMTGTAMAGGK